MLTFLFLLFSDLAIRHNEMKNENFSMPLFRVFFSRYPQGIPLQWCSHCLQVDAEYICTKLIKINFSRNKFVASFSDFNILAEATFEFDIIDAPSPDDAEQLEVYDPNEYVQPSVELNVPLRFEIKPTPVGLNMPRSNYYNDREDDYLRANRFDIRPDNVVPDMEMTSFHHVIQK